ncbi:unnamed protein product [Rotaria sp. Silwood1]|nr:unnamed protein product [Rotaria sp. Silwood1]CAF3422966.1 unnamed protein product [Rotaria sp. Silwood1]CAF3424867.1 unnamed protein product [Rotaria sp. Silwood1]CAF4609734.1 unnamed protein product [Rotaria sp. Silwood1]CAF4636000.1 unnamed protein product [Rotaria sp. Silwood1]
MTTTTTLVNAAETSPVSPSLFNIQYPNCRRGMFSLREPFQNVKTEFVPTEKKQLSNETLTTPGLQPTNFNANQVPLIHEKPIEPVSIPPRKLSKRNAEVQCSLLKPTVYHDMAVQTKNQRQPIAVNDFNDNNDISPRYRRQKKLQPIEQPQKIYEIWDIESPSLRTIPIKQTRRPEEQQIRYVKTRKPIIDYDDDDDDDDNNDDDEGEFDDDDEERIIYARQPRQANKKSYLPPNVRMICVREDTKRVF